MEDNLSNIPDEIESLLFGKDYGELSVYEKHTVSEYMSETDYSRSRAIIRTSKDILAKSGSVLPAPDIRDNLILEFRKKHNPAKSGGSILRLFQHSVPAYRFAAAIVVIIASLLYFDKDKEMKNVLIADLDTVYISEPSPVSDTIYKTIEIIKLVPAKQRLSPKSEILLADSSMPVPDYYGNNTARVIEAVLAQKYGTAFSDDEKYMKFLTIAN